MNELLAGIGQRISSARKSKKMTQEALEEPPKPFTIW